MSDEAIVYVASDGTIIYRASGIGGCIKSLIAARLDYDPMPVSEKMRALFRSGHEAEEEAVAWLEGQGVAVLGRQSEARLPITGRVSVLGHIDGLVAGGRDSLDGPLTTVQGGMEARLPHRWIAEIKSQSNAEWLKRKNGNRSRLQDRYDWQASMYMFALDLPLVWYWWNRDAKQMDSELVILPPVSMIAIRTRVLEVEHAARSGVVSRSCDNTMYPCPYFYLHDEEDEQKRIVQWDEEGNLEPINDKVIEVFAKSYKRSALEEDVARKRKDVVRKALRDSFEGRTVRTENGWKVTFFDSSRVVEITKPEPTPFAQESTWENIRVTPPKGWDDG